ncbi:MAG: hypothetical protein LBL62_06385 [Planctomycetaceae bacterium]|nr:hypothetical protein [Planctomycetaceae bacterium]
MPIHHVQAVLHSPLKRLEYIVGRNTNIDILIFVYGRNNCFNLIAFSLCYRNKLLDILFDILFDTLFVLVEFSWFYFFHCKVGDIFGLERLFLIRYYFRGQSQMEQHNSCYAPLVKSNRLG